MAENIQPKPPTIQEQIGTAITNKTVSDKIISSIGSLVEQGQLVFPEGYNYGNECKLAYLKMAQNEHFRDVTTTSIANALVDMALQALSPSKNQCYFIPYGKEMKMFRSYFGDISVAYSTGLVKDIKATIVKEGDKFEVDIVNDEEVVVEHHTSFANRANPIMAAYAVAIMADGKKRYCVMSKAEIDKSWSKSKSTGTQKDFPTEMAKRTVIRRLVKMIFNTATSKDPRIDMMVASYNRTTEDEYDNVPKYSRPTELPASPNEPTTEVNNNIIPADEDGVVIGDTETSIAETEVDPDEE